MSVYLMVFRTFANILNSWMGNLFVQIFQASIHSEERACHFILTQCLLSNMMIQLLIYGFETTRGKLYSFGGSGFRLTKVGMTSP
jgi:hypothetical protein